MEIKCREFLHEVTNIRRELHMYPEKGFEEIRTSQYIADYLRKLGMNVITGIAKTGVISILKGCEGKYSIAVRADMDCLEVDEQTGASFSSKIPGMMHACGHDGHMAAVLGLAKYLFLSGKQLKNNIVFIFQPAEEGPGGAEEIVKSGILDNLNIKAFLAFHILPLIEQGKIGCCSGPITARNGEVDIEIIGKSGHGASPHTAVDSIVCASQIIQGLQTIVSRKIDPMDNAVVSFGRIYGGKVRNIIAEKTTIEGTIRAFSENTYNIIKQSIKDICTGICSANGCKQTIYVKDMYPEVVNDNNIFNILLRVVQKDEFEHIKPLMIAEDFSFYRKVAPQLMFFLGSRNQAKNFIYPLHNPRFNFDEEILIKAISVFLSIIYQLD